MKPHKWAKEIKAWADGAEIEFKEKHTDEWKIAEEPKWFESREYRIKPQPKEPQYLYVYQTVNGIEFGFPRQIHQIDNFKDKFTCIGKIKLENDD